MITQNNISLYKQYLDDDDDDNNNNNKQCYKETLNILTWKDK